MPNEDRDFPYDSVQLNGTQLTDSITNVLIACSRTKSLRYRLESSTTFEAPEFEGMSERRFDYDAGIVISEGPCTRREIFRWFAEAGFHVQRRNCWSLETCVNALFVDLRIIAAQQPDDPEIVPTSSPASTDTTETKKQKPGPKDTGEWAAQDALFTECEAFCNKHPAQRPDMKSWCEGLGYDYKETKGKIKKSRERNRKK